MPRIRVEAPCHPTESPGAVRRALLNLFPDAQLTEGEVVAGETQSLDRFAQLLEEQRIRAAAREILSGAIRGRLLVFHLGKQAAWAGRVSFSAFSPLGDILVTVEADDPQAIVDRVAPVVPARG